MVPVPMLSEHDYRMADADPRTPRTVGMRVQAK
jgi:hypothetical protein